MTWTDFYLISFAVGFIFSFLAFFLGGIHWHLPFHLHLPFDAPHVPLGGRMGAGQLSAPTHGHTPHISALNPLTIAAFLAWFGGTGYLLSRFSAMRFFAELLLSVLAGMIAAIFIFLFMTRVLISREENLDAADYEMAGVLGRITSSIRAGGTGELVYSQAGTRRVCGARSEDGKAIAKGCEVVVTAYEKGIAYVRPWEELTGQEQTSLNSVQG